MKGRNDIKKGYQLEIDSFLQRMKGVPVNIMAVSRAEQEGQAAVVYVTSPISPIMILPDNKYVPGKPSRMLSIAAARGGLKSAAPIEKTISEFTAVIVAGLKAAAMPP